MKENILKRRRVIMPGCKVIDSSGRTGVVKAVKGNYITIDHPDMGLFDVDIREHNVELVSES